MYHDARFRKCKDDDDDDDDDDVDVVALVILKQGLRFSQRCC